MSTVHSQELLIAAPVRTGVGLIASYKEAWSIPTAGDKILHKHLEMKHLNEILPYVKNIGDEDLRRLGLALGLYFPTLKRMRNLPEDLTGAWLNREENVLKASGEPTYERLAVAMEEIGQTGMALDVRNQKHAKQKKK